MKKSLSLLVAFLFVFSFAGSVFAAEGPFSDVPKDHWSYAAVNQLVKSGIVEGAEDGEFHGDRVLSRYEMAVIVAKAMKNVDKADEKTKATIDRMYKEYHKELNNLGIRVKRLEKAIAQAEPSLIDWTGTNIKAQYQRSTISAKGQTSLLNPTNALNKTVSSGVTTTYPDSFMYSTQLVANSRISENWTMQITFEAAKNSQGEDVVIHHLPGRLDLSTYTITGNMFGGEATLGRTEDVIINGLVYDDWTSGVRFKVGDKTKATLYVGKVDNASPASYNGLIRDIASYINCYDGINLYAADIAIPLSKATKVYGAGYITTNYRSNYQTAKIGEIAVSSKLSPITEVKADWARSNYSDNNRAYLFSLKFKDANKEISQSSGWTLNYVHNEAKATIENGQDFRYNYYYATNTSSAASTSNIFYSGDITFNGTTTTLCVPI
ncbi:MAG: S-layer protein [Firmicutes bacterium]|nr:S-layer protein [Bacillota bacterium]